MGRQGWREDRDPVWRVLTLPLTSILSESSFHSKGSRALHTQEAHGRPTTCHHAGRPPSSCWTSCTNTPSPREAYRPGQPVRSHGLWEPMCASPPSSASSDFRRGVGRGLAWNRP